MGCGTSNKAAVVPVMDVVEDINEKVTSLYHDAKKPTASRQKVIRRPSETLAVQGVDPPVETLAAVTIRRRHIGPPLAFEVPVAEDGYSLIRKHPPRRFQRLEDQQQVAVETLTHELLDVKQAEADRRRIELMSQRVQSAKVRVPKRRFAHLDALSQLQAEDSEEGIETLRLTNSRLQA